MKTGAMTTTSGMQSRWTLKSLLITCLLGVAIAFGSFSEDLIEFALTAGIVAALAFLFQCLTFLYPLVTLRHLRRSIGFAARSAWPQAYFYNVLAQERVRQSAWLDQSFLFAPSHLFPTAKLFLQSEAGRILIALNRWQEAERCLKTQVVEFPKDAVSRHNLAIVDLHQGRFQQAKSNLTMATQLGATQPVRFLYRTAALVYRLTGFAPESVRRIAEAKATFYQSLGFHQLASELLVFDSSPIGCWKRTWSHLALNRRAQADAEVRRSLRQDSDNPHAWLSLGLLYGHAGDYTESARAFQAALRRDPEQVLAKEQLYILWARTHDDKGRLNALALLQEYETNSRHEALGRVILHHSLGNWGAALEAVPQVRPEFTLSSLLEVVGHSFLNIGLITEGTQLLSQFIELAEVSESPMLDRTARLTEAREALRGFRRPESGSLSS